ncbi:Protein MAEA [Phytophthora citrophthora]|uniref:Protein MAEA n=1 Tax=Phytophthora citrophthora TaxID=4793 RepID=A0AAD9G4N5_9STRA|nr:Protein MAEA [Phytophthora citrophthora]
MLIPSDDQESLLKMELSYPLVRVPFEGASKSFRLYHKQLTRELAQTTAQIEALDGDGQQPGHRMDVDSAIDTLNELAKKLRDLKQSAKDKTLEQQNDLESCATRTRYLETLEKTKIGGDPSINDRLIADYLLGQGYLESAKIVQDTKEIHGLVDYDLHQECQVVLRDLQAHHTDKAITWCSQNGTRLRRLQSPLEFHLRLQDFIEFVRAHKPLEAVQYARAHLTPLAMQPEMQTLRDAAIGEVQIAMATLAFESPEKCGIDAYEKVFAMDRWLTLEKMFRKTFNDVYGMHDPPSLCIALHAGLSTLNTRACHLTRDANLKARLAQSGARCKRQRREGDGTGDVGNEYSDSETDELIFRSRGESKDDTAANLSDSKKRKYTRAESPVPICPACSEVGSQLCIGLPFAYHPHSRLVCRVTQSVMDEHNPPLMLPNGQVYSKKGIELLTQRSSDGTIKCIDTQDVFLPTEVKPVYIL